MPMIYRETQTSEVMSLPLRTAYVCAECRQITDGAPHGVCQCCGSSAVRSVAQLLLSAEERQTWLNLVQGQLQARLAKIQRVLPQRAFEGGEKSDSIAELAEEKENNLSLYLTGFERPDRSPRKGQGESA